ncbi:hypothetical protein B4U80_12880 [Leptotrombidium deliense]|uniref:Uncharacterized protein n=1 Tax=Leptotrombidium deliense TaxID=299467 RepID=A0A443SIH8_9ACAR|nr:hypothetical protein B4U80_12880 [Leptotrombidium deliense]
MILVKLFLSFLIVVSFTQTFDKDLDIDKKIDDSLVKKSQRLANLKLKDQKYDFRIPVIASGEVHMVRCVLKGLQTVKRKGKSTSAIVKGNQQITVMLTVGAMSITGSLEVITDQTYRVNLKGKATSAEIKIVLVSKPNAKKGICQSVKITKMTGFDTEVDSGDATASMMINAALEGTKENYEPEVIEEVRICDHPKVNALTTGNNDGEIYVFNNDSYWTFDIRFASLSNEKDIKQMWRHILVPIDAADIIKIEETFYMVFITRDIYWMYKSEYNIENNPQLVSSGMINMKMNKSVRAIQFATSLTFDNETDVNCTICTHDFIIYDCKVNTTVDLLLDECVEVTEFSKILPEEKCESLTYVDSSIIVIADSNNYVFTNLTRNKAFQTFTFKDHLYTCGEQMSTFSVPVVAGCVFLIVANVAVALIVYEQKKKSTEIRKQDTERSESEDSSRAGSDDKITL